MSVYVDNSMICYGSMRMSHMIADTHEELIAMVQSIGVQTKWIQHEGSYREHFDVCVSKRQLAITAGAIEVDAKSLVRIMLEKREQLNKNKCLTKSA